MHKVRSKKPEVLLLTSWFLLVRGFASLVFTINKGIYQELVRFLSLKCQYTEKEFRNISRIIYSKRKKKIVIARRNDEAISNRDCFAIARNDVYYRCQNFLTIRFTTFRKHKVKLMSQAIEF